MLRWRFMENFRDFEAGPDPFDRTWRVQLKWLQTAISIRNSDSVDVKFVLRTGDSESEKVVALMHPDLLALSAETGHPLTDSWCGRLAALHLKKMIETGEDMEKDLVTALPAELKQHAGQLRKTAA